MLQFSCYASVAQLVERIHGKDEVSGSSPLGSFGEGEMSLIEGCYESLVKLGVRVSYLSTDLVRDYSSEMPEGRQIGVYPDSVESVGVILKCVSKFQLPVYPRGSGTGTTGAVVPLQDGVVIFLGQLSQIEDIDLMNQVAVVQVGVITGDFQKACEREGLFYPPDPASLDVCTIGGNIAVNAGGPRALKYGVTRDFVMGLSGYWVDGTPFDLGGKNRKDVSGYDLKHLLIGSEGTLGVVTRATLKLLPFPKYRCYLHARFESYEEALQALSLIRDLGCSPSMVEFLDVDCLKASSRYLAKVFPWTLSLAHLVIELDDFSEMNLENKLESLKKCLLSRACKIDIPDLDDVELLMQFRRVTSLALKSLFPAKKSHDVVVPVSEIPSLMRFLPELSEMLNVKVLGYGHLGDGNVHVNFLSHEPSVEIFDEASYLLFQKVLSLGGSLTGEHGIGLTKRPYLKHQFSVDTQQFFEKVKRVFDPENRLNPGKAI